MESEFAQFAQVGEAIGQTRAKLEKIRILADYLRSLDAAQLPIAAIYLTGRALPQNDIRTLQAGWAVIIRALQGASKMSDADLHRITASHGDAGKSAREILQKGTKPEPFSLVASREFFENVQRARGPIAKSELLQRRLERLTPEEGEYLVKILTSDLRIGLKEGLVEEAIARAFDTPLNEVKEANMLLGDIGETALKASTKDLASAELSVFRPIKSMLASPEPTAEAIWQRFMEMHAPLPADEHATPHPNPLLVRGGEGETTAATQDQLMVFVEDKFDGIRAQVHRTAGRVEIYSRDLRLITDQFYDLAEHARSFADEVILDGEIIAFEEGRRLTFFDLQKRLGRKNEGPDLFSYASADVPVLFVAFDLLWRNGRSFLRTPLRERRAEMREIRMPAQFRITEMFPARSATEIDQIFDQARARSNEGLMVKDPESFYSPGRRGLYWFKLKKELATLDVVVVGAELGHGKRNHVLSDYTFAVRDESSGDLLPIGKAYSGLTDAEIAELTEHFKANTLVQHGRYREVKPDTILEIAFDSIQPSNRHASGLALRFPRIKAIRRDKTVEGIDTLAYARELAASGGFKV